MRHCRFGATKLNSPGGESGSSCGSAFGVAGCVVEQDIERSYRDARLLRLYQRTSQIQKIVIARNVIKQARLVVFAPCAIRYLARPDHGRSFHEREANGLSCSSTRQGVNCMDVTTETHGC